MTIKKISILTIVFVILLTGNIFLISGDTLVIRKPVKIDTSVRKKIFAKVFKTSFIDTHEHLIEEHERLTGVHRKIKSDDWTILFSYYTSDDMLSAGMSKQSWDKFFSPKADPLKKWEILEPYWPKIKNTGYGKAVQITIKELYGIDELSAKTIKKLQTEYVKTRRPGFYKRILHDMANIESCQVNYLGKPFNETQMPQLLMQDIEIAGFVKAPAEVFVRLSEPSGIKVNSLSDWHKVIDWWFDKYGKYAVAVKSKDAYHRDIDYDRANKKPTPAMEVTFQKRLNAQPVTEAELKALQDHLFWYSVNKANEYNLPIKLHTGHYGGHGYMPLSRLSKNPASAAELCHSSPETKFVFFHIGYPYYEEMISLSKYYTNAYIDMCLSWILNPVAAKDFLKKYLVTAPANKILTFGGDYVPVELVLGHATMARQGIALALSELVEEGWFTLDQALAMVDPIMHQNARNIFDLDKKTKLLKTVEWKK